MKLKTPIIDPEAAKKMLQKADLAKDKTYPKPGGYTASVLAESGNIYEGISYKSETYTLTMHCEATALANAAIHGEKTIVAITGPNCHMCKQLIWESALHSGTDIQIVFKEKNTIKLVPISELMLYPWPKEGGVRN